jgi:hypothetical protein
MTQRPNRNNATVIPPMSTPTTTDLNDANNNPNPNPNAADNQIRREGFVNGILNRNAALNAPGPQVELLHNMNALHNGCIQSWLWA